MAQKWHRAEKPIFLTCYCAFSNRLQSWMEGTSQQRKHLPACSCAHAFCQLQLQFRIAGTSHEIDHRVRSLDNWGDSALVWGRPFLFCFLVNRVPAKVSRVFLRPHLPKVVRPLQFLFELQTEFSLQFRALLSTTDNFSRSKPETAETQTLLSGNHHTHKIKMIRALQATVEPANYHVPELLLWSILFHFPATWHDVSTWWCENWPWLLARDRKYAN